MSLINEALKKAQRQRIEPAVSGTEPVGDAATRPRPAARGLSPQTWLLLIAGAVVLMVISVVFTVHLLSGPTPSAAVSVTPPPVRPTVGSDTAAPSPVIIAPVVPKPSPTTESQPPPAAGAASIPPVEAPTPVSTPAPTESTLAAPAVAAASAPVLPKISTAPEPSLRAQEFVDAIRVTGIRSSGTDSKVLMNERVYRVNDVVERSLGLKLIKVAPDSLTFSDPNGVIYTKTF